MPALPLPLTPLDGRGSADTPFTFCSVFKMEDRKNWQALVAAFWTEFSEDDDVLLLLRTYVHSSKGLQEKGSYIDQHDEIKANIRKELISSGLFSASSVADMDTVARLLNRIIVVSEHLSSSEMVQFYKHCQAFVLPTHGEGW